MNQLTAEHPLDVTDLLSPINQPMADVEYVSQETKKSSNWFMKLAEASYEGWRRNGSQSYGL